MKATARYADVPAFLRDRLGFLEHAAATRAPVAELALGRKTLLLTQPADVEHVLLRNQRAYTKTPRLVGTGGRRLLGTVLITVAGDAHLERRRSLAPAFQRRLSEELAGHAVPAAAALAERSSDGEVVDVESELAWLARRTIRHALFGTSSSAENPEFDRAVETRRRAIERSFRVPVVLPWPAPLRGHRAALRLLRATIDAELQRGSSGEPRLLPLLDEALGRSGAREEAVMLLVTGHETLGVALAWTLHLIATHPDVEARLLASIPERDPTPADLPALAVAAGAFDEALRLYPPTWIFVRVALGPDVLPSGVRVEPGTKLYLSPYVLHRSPGLFPDPERFDPDRSLDEGYIPFGGGPRLCIGKRYARAAGTLALAALYRRVRFEPVSPGSVTPEPGIVLRPRGGLPLRVRKR